MAVYCQFDPQEQISVKFESENKPFIHENVVQNGVLKTSAILLRPLCVNECRFTQASQFTIVIQMG